MIPEPELGLFRWGVGGGGGTSKSVDKNAGLRMTATWKLALRVQHLAAAEEVASVL